MTSSPKAESAAVRDSRKYRELLDQPATDEVMTRRTAMFPKVMMTPRVMMMLTLMERWVSSTPDRFKSSDLDRFTDSNILLLYLFPQSHGRDRVINHRRTAFCLNSDKRNSKSKVALQQQVSSTELLSSTPAVIIDQDNCHSADTHLSDTSLSGLCFYFPLPHKKTTF